MQLQTDSLRPTIPAMPAGGALPFVTLENTESVPAPVFARDDVRAPSIAPSIAPSSGPIGVLAKSRAKLERMPCRVFHVAGAEVDAQRMLFGLLPWLRAERCEVENLSKGGMAFDSRLPMARGEHLNLSVRIPGQREALELRAEVRWCERSRYEGYHIGVRFLPFGEGAARNPRSVLEALRKIEAQHV